MRAPKRADGLRTRTAILGEAVSLATIDGLDGLSIGKLAGALGISKSGLYAHFGSKEELQLAIVNEAARIFTTQVVEPGMNAEPGLARLIVVCDSFLDHLERHTFPGGCFFSGAVLELGVRPGAVNERVGSFVRSFAELIGSCLEDAVARGELPPSVDPEILALDLHGILLAANTRFIVGHDVHFLELARRAARHRLDLECTSPTRTMPDVRSATPPPDGIRNQARLR
jgi:AcrR family transcriptional regulator